MASRLPRSMEELNAATLANSKVTGYGAEVATVLPCPFCATPNFLTMKLAEMAAEEGDYSIKGHCGRCGRSAEARVTKGAGSTIGEFVQTGGDDPPEWLQPPMPRAEASA